MNAATLRTCRDGLWIVIDIIDDVLESTEDPEFAHELAALRGQALDLVYHLRQLEKTLDLVARSPTVR